MATIPSEIATATLANSGGLATKFINNPHFHQVLREILCAALAAVVTITWLHPIDVVKTRLQIGKTNENDNNVSYASLIRSLVTNEGKTSLYRGITAAWIAEAVYYGLQLGLYEPLKNYLSIGRTSSSTASSKFSTKLLAGAFAGSFGAVTGNPFVVVRTRMVADTGPRRSMAWHIGQIHPLSGFYQGFSAMFVRCIVLSASKMATYDTCKTVVQRRFGLDDGLVLRFWSAFVAGFFITATVMPFDMIRTRMMLPKNQQKQEKHGETGKTNRSGFVQCAKEVYEQYGFGGFYRGACAFWVRIAPKTCLQLILFEHLKQSHWFRWKPHGKID